MIPISYSQIKRLHQLLTKVGQMDNKADLVSHYSSGRTRSSRELSSGEANELISHLISYEKQNQAPAAPDPLQKMRKKVIYYAHLMKWEKPGGKADMERLNGWCLNYGKYHKLLNQHSKEELTQLIVQIENTYKSFLKSIAK